MSKRQHKEVRRPAHGTRTEIPNDFDATMESPALRRNVEKEVLEALENEDALGSEMVRAWKGLDSIQYRVADSCDDGDCIEQLAEGIRERLLVAMKRHLGIMPEDADPPEYAYDI